MNNKIQRVGVIGAGVMGAQIAGHLANCGVDVLLLDIVPPEGFFKGDKPAGWRNFFASSSKEKLKKSKPPALFSDSVLEKIDIGNLTEDLDKLSNCDWIIEAVVENIKIKRDLFEKIEKVAGDQTIISSNTSGLSLSLLKEGRGDLFKKNFLITHFFNPVRYMKLVEFVYDDNFSSETLGLLRDLVSERLGKGVVKAKDTPGFIANRIGLFHAMNSINKTFKNNWPIDLVDQVMGAPSCFPRSAIFRTADLVGIDTLLNVAHNTIKVCKSDQAMQTLIPNEKVEKLVEGGVLGVKAGVGFYKKDQSGITVIDAASMSYREKKKYDFASLKETKRIEDPGERLKALFQTDDEASVIAKELIIDTLSYVVKVASSITDSVLEIDNAMKWGYNWEIGPFEMIDALGVDNVEGADVLLKDNPSFYEKNSYLDFVSDNYFKKHHRKDSVSKNKTKSSVVSSNASASLVSVGDGVLCCEFHSKMNSIDPDIISMINEGLDLLAVDKYQGMLITNDASDFSVGANLFLIAMAISAGQWDQIEQLVVDFQNTCQRIRFSKRPVAVAPFGRTLGGGCELCLASNIVLPAAETYMGLVELGVGLIPAGGGCKNLLLNLEKRSVEHFRKKLGDTDLIEDGGPFPKVSRAFETIAMAKVSKSGLEASEIGFYHGEFGQVIDREDIFSVSRELVLKAAEGYETPLIREDILLPGDAGLNVLKDYIDNIKLLGNISDYDSFLASNLAYVLCGGKRFGPCKVSEQDILDLEREVFLKLCGRKETAERIQYMLTTGKPLRN